MKIVIVEDEPHAQQELIRLLKLSGRQFDLLARIDSVEDSIEWFSAHAHPDLVFLDIQLADGLSFDIFREIELRSAVIFTTAYDEYAIRAFKLNSIDYLLKPIKAEALETALDKFERMKKDMAPGNASIDPRQLLELVESMSPKTYKKRFMVRLGEQIKSIGTHDIAYFKAEDNVVFLVVGTGQKYIVEHSLENLEAMLDPQQFFRLNRAFIASLGSIKKVSRYFNNRLLIELDPGDEDEVLVSRARVKEFMDWLDR
jgi:DNA-binding LytR/AlgR family response regulator